MDRKDYKSDGDYFAYLDAVEDTEPQRQWTYRAVTQPIGKTLSPNHTKIYGNRT